MNEGMKEGRKGNVITLEVRNCGNILRKREIEGREMIVRLLVKR